MSEPPCLIAHRQSYDTVATDYAERSGDALATMPLSRAMLAAFAELVLAAGAGPVADVAQMLEEPGEGQTRQYVTFLPRKPAP
ncbi:hypothetical protein [Streptosporangium sp. NPDC000396]|uniref:hypothetical protein n=1 Tax=Streptosporangium sp. NPDC000396 TaxID=3366185 RepID=UPI003690C3AF